MLKFLSICLAVATCQAGPLPSQAGSGPNSNTFNLVQDLLSGGGVGKDPTPAKKPSSVIEDYLRGTGQAGVGSGFFPSGGMPAPSGNQRDGFGLGLGFGLGDGLVSGLSNMATTRPTTAPPLSVSTGSATINAINCREFVFGAATTIAACSALRQADFVAGPAASTNEGICRWDPQSNTCWCPRMKDNCDNQKQCFWNRDPSLTGNFATNPNTPAVTGECISNAERFYNVLSALLSKRGKKDFAVRIAYSSAPARGQLPLGPYGAAIIGAGSNIRGSMPSSLPIPGYGAPSSGYGLPNQVMLGMPPFSLPQSGFQGFPGPFTGFPH